MPLRTIACLVLLVASTCGSSEPAPDVGSDQHWFIRCDIRALMEGRTGRWIDRLAEVERVRARLALFAATTGVDPRTDIEHLWMSGPDARPMRFVGGVVGRLDAAKLVTLVSAAEQHRVEPHRGADLHVWSSGVGEIFAGFARQGRAVAAGRARDAATAALDALDGAAPAYDSVRLPPLALPDRARPILEVGADSCARWVALPDEAGLARRIAATALRIAERDGVLVLRAALVADNADAAKRFASIADGLLSMAAMDQRVRVDDAALHLIDSARVTRDGTRVDLVAELPVALAEKCWDAQIRAAIGR